MNQFSRARQRKLATSGGEPWALAGAKANKFEGARLAKLQSVDEQKGQDALFAQFFNDEKALHGLDRASRLAAKKHILKKYEAHLNRVLAQTGSCRDPILEHAVIWSFDLGDEGGEGFARFFEYYDHAARLGMKSPLKRSFAEFKYWSILNWANNRFKQEKDVEPWFSAVFAEVFGETPESYQGVKVAGIHPDCLTGYLALKFKLALKNDGAEALGWGEIALEAGAAVKTALTALRKKKGL